MTMRRRLLAVALAVLIPVSRADAQVETFVQSVRELAMANEQAEPSRSSAIRTASNRMAAALAEWDRQLADVEMRTRRDLEHATREQAARLHAELGVAYRTRGRFTDAVAEFSTAASLMPASPDLQVLKALALETAAPPPTPGARFTEAQQAFHLAWTLDPSDPVKTYLMLSRAAFTDASERERAQNVLVATYRRLRSDSARVQKPPFIAFDIIPDDLGRAPVVGDQRTADAFSRLTKGKYDEAAIALRDDQGVSHESPRSHFEQAQRDEATNHVKDARREYEAALTGTLVGRSAIAVTLGKLAAVDGDLDGAIDAFALAVQVNPNDPRTRRALASAYAADGKRDEAFRELIAALLIDSRDALTHAVIGQWYLDAGQYAEAVAACSRALELSPSAFEVRYVLATALTRSGNTTEAARQFETYERDRREAQERRRHDIANEVEPAERAHGR
jgi:tetratricopeptide (TPR) repeat protein